MSDLAETYFQQAQAAIQVGDFAPAMDLLRKARLLVAADNELLSRILVQMIQIAPHTGADSEAQTWRQLLSQLRSIDGLPAIPASDSTNSVGRRSRARPVAIGMAKYGTVLLAGGILFIGALWFWRLSASRYRPTTTSGPSTGLGGE